MAFKQLKNLIEWITEYHCLASTILSGPRQL